MALIACAGIVDAVAVLLDFNFSPSTVEVVQGGFASVDVRVAAEGGRCTWELRGLPAGISAQFVPTEPGCRSFAIEIEVEKTTALGSYSPSLIGTFEFFDRDRAGESYAKTLPLRVIRAPIPTFLDGTVTDTADAPIQDAYVSVSMSGTVVGATQTDGSGEYAFEVDEGGDYTLTVMDVFGLQAFTNVAAVTVPDGGVATVNLSVRDAHTLVVANPLGSTQATQGATVTLPGLDWKVWSREGCPACSHWLVLGVDATPQVTLEVGQPGLFAGGGGGGSETFQIVAPTQVDEHTLWIARFAVTDEQDARDLYTARFADPNRRDREFIPLGTLEVVPSAATTITWTGGAGTTDWYTAGNWDLGRVPESGDDVVIPEEDDEVVFGQNAAATPGPADTVRVASLEVAGTLQVGLGQLVVTGGGAISGTLDLTGLDPLPLLSPALRLQSPLEVSGSWFCDGGQVVGSELVLTADATSTIARDVGPNPTCHIRESTVVRNHGALTVGPAAYLAIGPGATLRNEAAGTVDIVGSTLGCVVEPCQGTFENLGTANVTSVVQATFDVEVENAGLLTVQSAATFLKPLEHLGTLTAPTANLSLQSDASLQPGSSWTSERFTVVGPHTVTVAGELAVANLYFDGGAAVTVGATGELIQPTYLTLQDASTTVASAAQTWVGTLSVYGTSQLRVEAGSALKVATRLVWQGGTLTGAGVTTVVKRNAGDAEAETQINVWDPVDAPVVLDGHQLLIHGTAYWNGDIQAGNGALLEIREITNTSAGVLFAQGDDSFLGGAVGGYSTFRNLGLISKTAEAGETVIQACYDDGDGVGQVEALQGSVVFVDLCPPG